MEVIKKYLSNFICLKKGQVIFILALLFLGIFVPLESAYAAWYNPLSWGGMVLNGLMLVVVNIGSLIAMFALKQVLFLSSLLVWLAGFMLSTIINLDIPFTHCPLIDPDNPALGYSDCFLDSAWTIMRDIANMLLIVILVVIALATMLMKEGYGFKKAFLPLIGVALLVNFSKVIVGVVVDMSTIIMQIFLNEAMGLEMLTGSLADQGKSLLTHFGNFKFLSVSENIGLIAKTMTLIIFQVGFALILGLYAIIFLARYVALWLLTIFAPIAFVALILPPTRKLFTMWWGQLISWSFIGVTAGFSLWLIKLFASKIGDYENSFSAIAEDAQAQELWSGDPLSNFIAELLPYAVLLILLYATFMLALKTNAIGANMIIAQSKKLANKVKDSGKKRAKDAVLKKYGGAIQGVGARIAGSKYAKGRITGGLFRAAGKKVEKLGRADEKSWKDKEEEAKKRSKGMNRALAQTTNDPREYNAAHVALAEQDPEFLDKELATDAGKNKAESMIRYMSRAAPGHEKTITDRSPDLVGASMTFKIHDDDTDLQQRVEEAKRDPTKTPAEREEIEYAAKAESYTRHMKKDKAKNIGASSLANENVLSGLEKNENVNIFDDIATTPEKMRGTIKGYREKYGADAMDNLADRLKEKNIKNLPTLSENDLDELMQGLAKNANRITGNFVLQLAEHQGKEAVDKLFETLDPDAIKRLAGNPVIKPLMNPAALKRGGVGETPPTAGPTPAPTAPGGAEGLVLSSEMPRAPRPNFAKQRAELLELRRRGEISEEEYDQELKKIEGEEEGGSEAPQTPPESSGGPPKTPGPGGEPSPQQPQAPLQPPPESPATAPSGTDPRITQPQPVGSRAEETPEWLRRGLETTGKGGIPLTIIGQLRQYLINSGFSHQEIDDMEMEPEKAWEIARQIEESWKKHLKEQEAEVAEASPPPVTAAGGETPSRPRNLLDKFRMKRELRPGVRKIIDRITNPKRWTGATPAQGAREDDTSQTPTTPEGTSETPLQDAVDAFMNGERTEEGETPPPSPQPSAKQQPSPAESTERQPETPPAPDTTARLDIKNLESSEALSMLENLKPEKFAKELEEDVKELWGKLPLDDQNGIQIMNVLYSKLFERHLKNLSSLEKLSEEEMKRIIDFIDRLRKDAEDYMNAAKGHRKGAENKKYSEQSRDRYREDANDEEQLAKREMERVESLENALENYNKRTPKPPPSTELPPDPSA